MKSFTQLEEGILAGQKTTMETGDKISKKMAEVEAIKKNLVYLDIIWNNTYGGSKYTQDIVGTDINIGWRKHPSHQKVNLTRTGTNAHLYMFQTMGLNGPKLQKIQ